MREKRTVSEFTRALSAGSPPKRAEGAYSLIVRTSSARRRRGYRVLYSRDAVTYKLEERDRGRTLAVRVKVLQSAEVA